MSENDNEVVDRFEKSPQPSGGGDGVSVHIDSNTATALGLTPDDDITIELVTRDGKPELRITDLPGGFSEDEFLNLADERDWEHLVSSEDVIRGDEAPTEWGHTFKTDDDITIEADELTFIDGLPLNNVFVKTDLITFDDVDTYRKCLDIAEEDDQVYITVTDPDHLLTRLSTHIDSDIEDPPRPETVRMALEKYDRIAVQFCDVGCSFEIGLNEVGSMVDRVRSARDSLGIQ